MDSGEQRFVDHGHVRREWNGHRHGHFQLYTESQQKRSQGDAHGGRQELHRRAGRQSTRARGRGTTELQLSRIFTIAVVLLAAVRTANAQQSLSDVLSFLGTNRSIPTGDFVRDEQAAIATRDTISKLLVLELATLPSSSGGGFTYRLDPALGTVIRASDSFGPLFTERSLLAGRGRASFGISYSSISYESIDGRNLRDGTLVSTASVFRGEAVP